MTTYTKFHKSLKQGQKYEKKCLEYLDYDNVIHKEGYFKEYDLTIYKYGEPIRIEVKSDRQASKTGNLAIEYECNNKPSGITSTEADFWIYFIVYHDRDECYKIPIDDLKNLVKDCRKVSGGDGMKSRMYLLNKNKCEKYLIYKNINI